MSWKDVFRGRGGESELRDLDAEQPDKEWLDAESDRRREVHEARRRGERASRAARREETPTSLRLYAVERSLALTSTLPAVKGGGGGSRADTMAPPKSDPLEVGIADHEEVERLLRICRDATRKLEEIVDEHKGLGAGAGATPKFGSDLDALLAKEYRGYKPEDVSSLEPYLGSPAAVRKSRELMNLHRETGEPMPKKRSDD